jgi:hypothetical protein
MALKVRQDVLKIREIEESPINAHRQSQEEERRLANNIKKDGALTSAVLVMEQPGKKYMCISGHHRIKAAIKAGLAEVPVLIIPPIPESKRIALQLSHNDIKGEDDPAILAEMVQLLEKEQFDEVSSKSLSEEQRKELENIEYELREYHYINICFLPSTVNDFEAMLEELASDDDKVTCYLVPASDYEATKALLTRAHEKGFRTPGSAFRKFLDIAAAFLGGEYGPQQV